MNADVILHEVGWMDLAPLWLIDFRCWQAVIGLYKLAEDHTQ